MVATQFQLVPKRILKASVSPQSLSLNGPIINISPDVNFYSFFFTQIHVRKDKKS